MVFPQTPLDVRIDLQINGIWTDITSDVYTAEKITITRGRADEGQRVDPGKCTLTLNNRAGKYSPRNPLSPYYQLIGRNTPLRVSVMAGGTFLSVPAGATDRASTPDTAVLDITGDLDVRIEVRLDDWQSNTQPLELIGKWGESTNQKSWIVFVYQRELWLYTSVDGTTEWQARSTTKLTVPPSGRLALRCTIDVNDGAGNKVNQFFTAPTLRGPWTLLATTTAAGTTSIFNSTASLDIGAVDNARFFTMSGAVYRAEVRNGINGTVVANPDFTTQATGTGSFADSAGRTWTLNAAASVTNRRTRFVGEVSSWPSRWDVSGKDVRVPIEAAGILRRLGQGAKALDSSLRRRIPSSSPMAYWPMEEGQSSTQAFSPIDGVSPLSLSNVNWAAADSLASSKALPALASSGGTLPQMLGRVPAPASALTSWSVRWIYRLDTPNATRRTFMRVLSTGTVAEWFIQSGSTGSTIIGNDSEGNNVFTQGVVTGSNLFNSWVYVRFTATQNGGNVDWRVDWADIGGDMGGIGGSYAGTVGRPRSVASPPDGFSSDLDGMAIGHISVWNSNTTAAYSGAIDAWAGETAGARMTRLTTEEGVPFSQWGDATLQEQVGVQTTDTLLALLGDAEDADGGILYERRDIISLAYRDRLSMYNQPVALALDYNVTGHVAPPLEPVDDDQHVRNDVTVSREGGASGRAILESGPLSIQNPPLGVGVYDEAVTVNLYDDDQPEPHAYWRMHLGTWDESRYPVLNVDLAAGPSLIDQVTALESGDRVQIAHPPAWLPPGPIDLFVQGGQEVIGHPNDWDVQLNCTPAGPWTVAEVAITEDFEDTAFDVVITNGGNLPWARSTTHFNTGAWSLRSGAITNAQTSDAIVTVPEGSLQLTFWYWVSSEAAGSGFEGDRLLVLVDGVQVLRAQGTVGWTAATIDVTGAAAVTFRYIKDNSTAAGEDAAHIDDLTFVRAPIKADTEDCTLNGSMTTSSAVANVITAVGGVPWVDSATFPTEFPFDVEVGGEIMRVTSCTGTALSQTFAVVRGINGIVKTHSTGETVSLAYTPAAAL